MLKQWQNNSSSKAQIQTKQHFESQPDPTGPECILFFICSICVYFSLRRVLGQILAGSRAVWIYDSVVGNDVHCCCPLMLVWWYLVPYDLSGVTPTSKPKSPQTFNTKPHIRP